MKFSNIILFVSISIVLLLSGCDKDDSVSPEETLHLPTVITANITDITYNTAISGGEVKEDGGSEVIARGVVWCRSSKPTLDDNKTNDGSGLGSFTSNITDLQSGTNYHVRAYATNSDGTAYGISILFRTIQETGTVTDIDGNEYGTVKIGDQWWMAENLKVTRYNDGTDIDYPVDNQDWMDRTTGAYNWYNHNYDTYGSVYGALYNWHTIETGNLCPEGWVVPSDAEWTKLSDYLGGNDVAGGKLKSTRTEPAPHPRWNSPNAGATNESGFSALPGSMRFYHGGYSENYPIGSRGYYWTSTKIDDSEFAWSRFIYSENPWISGYDGSRQRSGRSVRCMMYEE